MRRRTSLSISARRHFVDGFFLSQKNAVAPGYKVIDIGGKRAHKRGLFDVDSFGAEVTYVNIEPATKPDILADATNIPVHKESYDVAIMGELLEHVPEPKAVLKEAHRVLKSGGTLLATVPFIMPVHGDPFDFGRYTEAYWKKVAGEIGFEVEYIQPQGTIFAVAALMTQHIFAAKRVSWSPIQLTIVRFFMWLDGKTTSPLLKAWTTGYGFVFKKK